ncbi:MAG: diguanylate cyclase [Massilia sp.]
MHSLPVTGGLSSAGDYWNLSAMKSLSASPDRSAADTQPGLLRRIQRAPLTEQLMRNHLLRNIALLVLWMLVWELAQLVEYTEHASVWFPVAGLTFAVFLIDGLRTLPALVAACVAVTVLTGHRYHLALSNLQLVQAGLLFALAHLLPYGTGAYCLRWISESGRRELPKLVVSFLLIAALSSGAAMVLVLWALVVSGMMATPELARAWLPFWIGDMAGVIVLAPFFAAVLSTLRPRAAVQLNATINMHHQRASARFKYKLLFNLLLLSGTMWLAHLTRSPDSAFAIFFLVIPSMWLACTESAFLNVLSLALGSFLIALLVHVLDLRDYIMVYQFAINVIAANTLFGLALPSLIADNIQLRRVADTDSLTQAASRVCLEQRAQFEIIRCSQEQRPLSLIVFDIDRFKEVNDLHGHAVGDRSLQHVCLMAQHCLRPNDMLGRFGGDEFVALMPGTGHEAAHAIAERIRLRIMAQRLAELPPLTASFGVAQWQADETYAQLFERADRALYLAKQAGRNQTGCQD